MNYNLPMPSLGADMEEGKIVEWKIKNGDVIKKNQIIASVETTKSVIDIESFREGIVKEILLKVGDVVQVGKPIAVLDIIGDEILDHIETFKSQQVARTKISPIAKKMAEENHIDLGLVKATGVDGEITLKDIEVSISGKFVDRPVVRNLRQAIGLFMSRSKKEIPHYYLKKRIQLDQLVEWIDEKNKKLLPDERLLLPVVLMRAVIISLKKFPELNGFYKENKFAPSEIVNLGIAISVKPEGVMAPAVLQADKMNMSELNTAVKNLAIRTREGGLVGRELSEGSITITNLGDMGCDEVFGIIFPPQVAIIGFGSIRKEPVVDRQDKIRAGFVVDMTLSADHRVSDGLMAARFLNEIQKILNDPSTL
jgi:pyruvate dehydrogenase E2 component (dihydrolipoamide acetyltransferase)